MAITVIISFISPHNIPLRILSDSTKFLLETLIIPQLVKKFPKCYRTQSFSRSSKHATIPFITACHYSVHNSTPLFRSSQHATIPFIIARHYSVLYVRSIQSTSSQPFLSNTLQYNIILPSMPRSSK